MKTNKSDHNLIEGLIVLLERGQISKSKKKLLMNILNTGNDQNSNKECNDQMIFLEDEIPKMPVQDNNKKLDQDERCNQNQLESLLPNNDEEKSKLCYQQRRRRDRKEIN